MSVGGVTTTAPESVAVTSGLLGATGVSGVTAGTGTTVEPTSGEDIEPFSATTVTAVPSATFSAGMVMVPSELMTRPESAGAVHMPFSSLLTTTVTGWLAPSGVKVMSMPVTFSTGGTIVTLPFSLVSTLDLAGVSGT
ncbi:Uncharacterised protein [Streptococcus suis]|nr:Uncharacterised protein [Streptococcus suis]